MPYFAMRKLPRPQEDSQELLTSKPSRRWIDLSSIQRDPQNIGVQPQLALFDAQTTIAVCGSDHTRWITYYFDDAYFGDDDEMENAIDVTVTGDQEEDGIDLYMSVKDDLTVLTGTVDTNISLWNPREYFVKVCYIRMALIRNEWQNIVRELERNITGYV